MNWSRIRGVFFRYFFTLKDISQLSDITYWPLVDILLWGLTSVWIQKQNALPNLPLILMTGLIFWQIAWRGAMGISFHLLQEFWHRNLVNLFSTPLKISEWICGMLLLGLCKLLGAMPLEDCSFIFCIHLMCLDSVGHSSLLVCYCIFLGGLIGFFSSSLIIYWGHKVEMLAWMSPFLICSFQCSVLSRYDFA